MGGIEANLLPELAIHRLLGTLARLDASLRKLPSVFLDPLTPKDLILRVAQDNSHIGAIAVTVYHVSHPKNL
jgi:hypothetical protein